MGIDQKPYLATNTSRRVVIEYKQVTKLLHKKVFTIINHTGLVVKHKGQ